MGRISPGMKLARVFQKRIFQTYRKRCVFILFISRNVKNNDKRLIIKVFFFPLLFII